MMMPFRQSTANLAQLLKAAADELRLSILQILATDSYGVMELAQAFAIKQSGMSHHLKVLTNAGLIDSRREGNSIFYRRSVIAPEDPYCGTKKALFQQLDNSSASQQLRDRLAAIWRERAATSRRFFLDNAEKFSAQQDLIASFDVYRHQVTEMLKVSPVPESQLALELGPGQGEFLAVLSEQFHRVIAIDNSPKMLTKAQQTVAHQELHNVELVLGDTDCLSPSNRVFQLAVINMVLHHTPSPSRIFQQIACQLVTSGVLLVTELCLHHQDWAQNACGDIWLGFAPSDLIEWAAEAQLEHGQSAYFALRNGFQVQIHQFIKSPI